ncbi:hypothetical protein V2J09_011657 [Rumex salicifolius]
MKSKVNGIEFGGYGTGKSVLERRYTLHKVSAACDDAEAIISLLTEEFGDENISSDVARKKVSLSNRENVVDKRSKSRKQKVGSVAITELAKQELKARRTDKNQSESHVSDSHKDSNVKMQCRSRVRESVSKVNSSDTRRSRHRLRENRASETADSSNKYEHLRGSSGFVDETSTTYLSKASGSEQYVGSESGLRDRINQSRQSESHVTSSLNDTSLKMQYNYGVGESVTKMNTSDLQRSGHLLKENRANVTSDSSSKYGYLTGSSGFVDEKSNSYLSKVSGSEEHVVSAGETSDSSYKYKHITDSSGNLSKRKDIKEQVDSAGGFCSSCGQVTSESEARTIFEQRSKLCAETKVASRQNLSSSLIANEAHEQHKQEHSVASNQVNLMKSEDYTERADVGDSYEENTNISRRRHSRLSETRLTSTIGQQSELVHERSHQEHIVAGSQTELMRENQESIELVDSADSNVKVSEENSVSVSSQTAKEEVFQTGQKQSKKTLRAQSSSSQVHFDGTMIEGSSSASEETLHSEQYYLTERIKETHEHVKETIKQTELRYEVQTPLGEPSFVKDGSRLPFVTSTSQVRIEEIGEDRDKRNILLGRSPRLDPPSQSIEVKYEHTKEVDKETELKYEVQTPFREPRFVKDTTRHPLQPFVTSTSQVIIEEICDEKNLPSVPSPSLDPHPQSLEITHEPAKETVTQTELRYEVQTLLREPNFIKGTSRHPYATTTSQVRIEEIGEEKEDETNVPSSSSPKLKPHSQSIEVQPVYVESAIDFPSQDSCKYSEGKSNININPQFIDVSPHVDLVVSTELMDNTGYQVISDSIKKIKPEESTSVIEVESKLPERKSPIDERSTLEQTLEQPPERQKSGNADTSQSGIVKRSGRVLWNVLTYGVLNTGGNVSGETNIELNVDKMSSKATVSTDLLQSDSIYQLQESGKEATGSGTIMEQNKDDKDMNINVASSSEENTAELRRGALLRSNQVMKERFGKWEEAYRLKSEQREIDQSFMKEAIEEAKKAADMWEVPVGAILVQDGKIIARGHNLVEESRDSTAHAEIVCIRAASSILKTWRLSETTLYVTLEPCAMCAGAILQSRIGTLVYGAPNKLLGADGSWVRLFPTSVKGEEGTESTSKTEGPIHPFHPNMKIRRGILEAECGELMQQSFKLRRNKGKKTEESSNKKLHNPSKLLHKMNHKFHIFVLESANFVSNHLILLPIEIPLPSSDHFKGCQKQSHDSIIDVSETRSNPFLYAQRT